MRAPDGSPRSTAHSDRSPPSRPPPSKRTRSSTIASPPAASSASKTRSQAPLLNGKRNGASPEQQRDEDEVVVASSVAPPHPPRRSTRSASISQQGASPEMSMSTAPTRKSHKRKNSGSSLSSLTSLDDSDNPDRNDDDGDGATSPATTAKKRGRPPSPKKRKKFPNAATAAALATSTSSASKRPKTTAGKTALASKTAAKKRPAAPTIETTATRSKPVYVEAPLEEDEEDDELDAAAQDESDEEYSPVEPKKKGKSPAAPTTAGKGRRGSTASSSGSKAAKAKWPPPVKKAQRGVWAQGDQEMAPPINASVPAKKPVGSSLFSSSSLEPKLTKVSHVVAVPPRLEHYDTPFEPPNMPTVQTMYERRHDLLSEARIEATRGASLSSFFLYERKTDLSRAGRCTDVSLQTRCEKQIESALALLPQGGQQTALCITMNRYSAFCAQPTVDVPVFPLTNSKLVLFLSRVPRTTLSAALLLAFPQPSTYPLPQAGVVDPHLTADEGAPVTRELVKSWIDAMAYAQMATRDVWMEVFDPEGWRKKQTAGIEPSAVPLLQAAAQVENGAGGGGGRYGRAGHPSLRSITEDKAVLEVLNAVETAEGIGGHQERMAVIEEEREKAKAKVKGKGKAVEKGKGKENGEVEEEEGPEKKKTKWVKGGKTVQGPSPGVRSSSSTSNLSAQARLGPSPADGMSAHHADLTTTPRDIAKSASSSTKGSTAGMNRSFAHDSTFPQGVADPFQAIPSISRYAPGPPLPVGEIGGYGATAAPLGAFPPPAQHNSPAFPSNPQRANGLVRASLSASPAASFHPSTRDPSFGLAHARSFTNPHSIPVYGFGGQRAASYDNAPSPYDYGGVLQTRQQQPYPPQQQHLSHRQSFTSSVPYGSPEHSRAYPCQQPPTAHDFAASSAFPPAGSSQLTTSNEHLFHQSIEQNGTGVSFSCHGGEDPYARHQHPPTSRSGRMRTETAPATLVGYDQQQAMQVEIGGVHGLGQQAVAEQSHAEGGGALPELQPGGAKEAVLPPPAASSATAQTVDGGAQITGEGSALNPAGNGASSGEGVGGSQGGGEANGISEAVAASILGRVAAVEGGGGVGGKGNESSMGGALPRTDSPATFDSAPPQPQPHVDQQLQQQRAFAETMQHDRQEMPPPPLPSTIQQAVSFSSYSRQAPSPAPSGPQPGYYAEHEPQPSFRPHLRQQSAPTYFPSPSQPRFDEYGYSLASSGANGYGYSNQSQSSYASYPPPQQHQQRQLDPAYFSPSELSFFSHARQSTFPSASQCDQRAFQDDPYGPSSHMPTPPLHQPRRFPPSAAPSIFPSTYQTTSAMPTDPSSSFHYAPRASVSGSSTSFLPFPTSSGGGTGGQGGGGWKSDSPAASAFQAAPPPPPSYGAGSTLAGFDGRTESLAGGGGAGGGLPYPTPETPDAAQFAGQQAMLPIVGGEAGFGAGLQGYGSMEQGGAGPEARFGLGIGF
ncbi:hypothetical protein JCM8547_002787 [Rhodosporidiobolus lusitaniae]